MLILRRQGQRNLQHIEVLGRALLESFVGEGNNAVLYVSDGLFEKLVQIATFVHCAVQLLKLELELS